MYGMKMIVMSVLNRKQLLLAFISWYGMKMIVMSDKYGCEDTKRGLKYLMRAPP